MFRLVLCSVFMILRAEANVPETENPVIRLSFIFERNEHFTVWKDKPLKIIIYNGTIRHAWCSNFYKTSDIKSTPRQFVPETEFTNGDIQILNIRSVTAEMSTRWVCTVLQEYHGPFMSYAYKNRNYTAKKLHFHLHVKGARAVILNANYQNLTYVTTNLSDNYDGQANYTYEDGEDIHFSCEKAKDNHNEDTLRLEYYNAEGSLLFETKPGVTPHKFRFPLKSNNDKYYLDCIRAASDPEREYRYRTMFFKGDFHVGSLVFGTEPGVRPHKFRFPLKSNNDKYYLDCIRAASDPEREFRYRTTFFKRDFHVDASQHAVILSVNGQKLSTNNEKLFGHYIFRYIDGEVLNVTFQKRDVRMRDPIFLYDERMSKSYRSLSSETVIISFNTSDIRHCSLICGINDANAEKPYARLFFLSDVPGNDVRIRGLPRNNILYQYTNDLNQWTIEYQYSVNDTLDLTCVWNEGFEVPRRLRPSANPFQWYFVGQSFDSAATAVPNTNIKFSDQPLTRILNATHIGNKIKCTYFPNGKDNSYSSKTVEIILRLKPEVVSEAKKDEVTSDTIDEKSESHKWQLGESTFFIMIVPIVVGAGVAMAVITMICLVSWRKRTKRDNPIQNAYDSVSNENDSPIPAFPSQWEDNYDDPNHAKIGEEVMQGNYNYATDKETLCRMPDERQSNTSENHYTEIDDYLKPKPDGQAANWNTVQPSDYNKKTDTPEATLFHSSNNACFNNFSDSKHLRQMSNDLRPDSDYSEGNSRQNNDRKVMQPGEPIYQNNFLQNEKTDNPLDSVYAEPYELGISCKDEFYG